jgi:competence protein ComEC
VKTRLLLALVASLLWVPHTSTQAPPAPPLKIHFVDVGQGDGVLIQTPSGHTVVYDAGENPNRMREYLEAAGVMEVDLAIASHNHADHVGGLPSVIRTFTPEFYMDNGVPTTTLAYTRVLEAAAEVGAQLLEPNERRISLGSVVLNIAPPPGIPAWDQNDNSIGIVLQYGSFRLSLAGDAEPREWASWLLNHGTLLGPVDVHKSSHHGSVNGDTANGIAALSPNVVIIGVGAGNPYRHPELQTLRMYADVGASVFRTDTNGTVIVEVQPTGTYQIHVERGEGAQPPSTLSVPSAPTFTLSGSATHTDGSPLHGVVVQALDGLNANSTAFTNSAGAYSLGNLQRGLTTIRFSKAGYTSLDRAAALPQATPLNVALTSTCTLPAAPTLSVSVSGHTATFSWNAIGGATGYSVQAGAAPGASGSLSTTTSSTSYSWSDVAAGSHYARVRATSTCGSSGASNEATFTITSTGGGSGPSSPPSSWTGPLPPKSSGRPVCHAPLPAVANCVNNRVGEAQALCDDGAFSCSTGSGTCSGHGGVYCWKN